MSVVLIAINILLAIVAVILLGFILKRSKSEGFDLEQGLANLSFPYAPPLQPALQVYADSAVSGGYVRGGV